MHSLEQSRKRRDLAEGFSPVKIPTYGKDGTAKHRWRVIPLTLGCVIIFLGLLLASVHIPVLLPYGTNLWLVLDLLRHHLH